MKNYYNKAEVPPLYYWRDNTGNEIDCLIDEGIGMKSLEIKSSSTINSDYFKGLNYYSKLNENCKPYLIYSGRQNRVQKDTEIIKWNDTKIITA